MLRRDPDDKKNKYEGLNEKYMCMPHQQKDAT
jgi:hypothetical protein